MERFKTNLAIGLTATAVGLAIDQAKYLAGEYDLLSTVLAIIIMIVLYVGLTYLLDGIYYIIRKLTGGK